MTSPASEVRSQQLKWAKDHGISVDNRGYTYTLDDNLFVPLCAESLREFETGDGAELQSKMRALHSSSALACNVFEFWRHRDAEPLASALGLPFGIERVSFEQKMRTGLPGNPPNLDVVLTLSGGPRFAIESKFLEPYGGRHHSGFKSKYFESRDGEWARYGFRNCQNLAEALQSGEVDFRWLHAEQLLKHLLGLARQPFEWDLMYLWYSPPGVVPVEHADEVGRFAQVVSRDGISFRSMTYQALYSGLRSSREVDHVYLEYLESRYFARSG